MVEKNLLARTPDGAIWLGSRLYGYGLTYASSLDYLAVAHEEMNRLVGRGRTRPCRSADSKKA